MLMVMKNVKFVKMVFIDRVQNQQNVVPIINTGKKHNQFVRMLLVYIIIIKKFILMILVVL